MCICRVSVRKRKSVGRKCEGEGEGVWGGSVRVTE